MPESDLTTAGGDEPLLDAHRERAATGLSDPTSGGFHGHPHGLAIRLPPTDGAAIEAAP